MTRQTRPRVMTLMTPIHLSTVIIDVDDAEIRNTGKGSDQIMHNFNGKIADKIIRFKLDEDPLQRRIYFITFIDSL